MLLDLDVPFGRKLLAFLCGVVITGLLVFIEVPLDLVLAPIPGLGIVLDFLINGSEALFAPLLFTCILLPRFVDRDTVERFIADEPLPEDS